MSKVCTFEEAASQIESGSTVSILGVIGWITPEKLYKSIRERFDNEGAPNNLTLFVPCYSGDNGDIKGTDNFMAEGMTTRIISGSYINPPDPKTGERPATMGLIKSNKIEAYSFHIGAMMHWTRDIARRGPGYMTKIGLDTFVDPLQGGGKLTPCTTKDIVERVNFKGEDYLYFPPMNLDVALIRASKSDIYGNLSFENDPLVSSALTLAMAVKACGGKVIVQVNEIVEPGERYAQMVKIPGNFVDHIVVDDNPLMVTGTQFDPAFMGKDRINVLDAPKLPLDAQKVIARRAAQMVRKDELAIFGFGASSNVPSILAEDGALDGDKIYSYPSTTEHGSYGGMVTKGWQFSANLNPDALIDGVTQFDAIHGGACKSAFLAFAQFDQEGNVNVSRFANANPGSGGFIDIAYNAERVIFTGTFTTAGNKVEVIDGKLNITKEGKFTKFVQKAEEVTYPVRKHVKERNQEAWLITERAVFQVRNEDLLLVEIAPGIDLNLDILEQMQYPITVAEDLKVMDSSLFTE